MEGNVSYEISPLERVAQSIGLSRFDIAQMLDATPGVIEAWLTGEMTPGPRSRQKLEELLEVLECLFEKMTPRAAHHWLTSASPALDYYEPLDLLRRGNLYAVMCVIEAMPRAIRLDSSSLAREAEAHLA
jgi:transcriptional regulator with XRE-family HTH domain